MAKQKFHINSDTNQVGKCSAKIRCRFGGESGMDNHFGTAEEAQQQVEKQFEKKFDTLQGTKKKSVSDNSDKKLFESLNKLEESNNDLQRKNQKLRESIEQELKKNVSLINKNEAKRDKIIVGLLKKDGVNALLDVDKARAIYNADWNNGSGSRAVSDQLTKVFKDVPYALQHIAPRLVTNDYSQSVAQLRVGIPRGAEPDKLRKLSDSFEGVFHTQREVMKDTDVNVTIDVFEDSLGDRGASYKIAYDDDYKTYELLNQGRSVTGKFHKNLKDAFVEVEKNASYGATEEYEAKNPGWNYQDEDDWAY